MELTQNKAKELFEYSNGALYWKVKPANSVNVGDKVGGLNGNKHPYLRLKYKEYRYLVHKVVFLYHHGYIPDCVDHIDGNSLNNNIENLREATKSQNSLNQTNNRKNNTSKCRNVYWYKHQNKWAVSIVVNKVKRFFGYFEDLELADLVATMAREKYHGQFLRN